MPHSLKPVNLLCKPIFLPLKHFIFSLHLLNGRIASLGSTLSHWRQDLFNGSVLIPLEAPHLFIENFRAVRDCPTAQYHVLYTFKIITHHSSSFYLLLLYNVLLKSFITIFYFLFKTLKLIGIALSLNIVLLHYKITYKHL